MQSTARSLARVLTTAVVCAACRSPGSMVAPGAPASIIPASVHTLSAGEVRLRDFVRAHHDEDIALLERVVNISSGTQNPDGVRQVGALFASEPGRGAHSLDESVNLNSLSMSAERAAVLMQRLITGAH